MSETTLDKWKQRAAAAEANRNAMPIVGAFVGEMQKAFGDVSVTYASENGIKRGKPGADGVRPVARHADPATSKRAAERAASFVGKHEAAIFAALTANPDGLTYREIATLTALEPVAVGRRLKGLQERAGVYPDGERGGMQIWRVKR